MGDGPWTQYWQFFFQPQLFQVLLLMATRNPVNSPVEGKVVEIPLFTGFFLHHPNGGCCLGFLFSINSKTRPLRIRSDLLVTQPTFACVWAKKEGTLTQSQSDLVVSHRIHGTGIFTCMQTIKINFPCRWIYRSSHGSFGFLEQVFQQVCVDGGISFIYFRWAESEPIVSYSWGEITRLIGGEITNPRKTSTCKAIYRG